MGRGMTWKTLKQRKNKSHPLFKDTNLRHDGVKQKRILRRARKVKRGEKRLFSASVDFAHSSVFLSHLASL